MNTELINFKRQIMAFYESKLKEEDLWSVIRSFRDKKNTIIEWITAYSAVKNNQINRPSLTKAVNENLIRKNEEGLIAKQDLEMYLTLRDFFKELENGNIVRSEFVKDKQQYLIFDTFKRNKTLPEYQTELLAKILEGFAKNYLGIDLADLISKKALELKNN